MIFIGHDGRETVATEVCERSIRQHASGPVFIQRLSEPDLRHSGIYRREWVVDGSVKFDARDHKPFSTDFSFCRFMVPTMMQHRGWALFVDGDFLFLDDVAKLFALADDRYAVMVVQHGPLPETGMKMDGQVQQPYFRKNWSSLVLWNCSHPANQRITPHRVNGMAGQWLHAFSWIDADQIGAIPGRWNWLAGIDPQPASGDPSAVHFTKGHPDMPGQRGAPYAEHWRKVKGLL